jgi:ubiquinone/menaquinone biosynthesis C-methylase UbiE
VTHANKGGQYLWGGHTDHHKQHAHRRADADLDFLLPYLRPGIRVVDLGCGPGSLTCDMAALVAPAPVVGIDITDSAITMARSLARERGLSNLAFEVGDAQSTGLPSESVDLVVSSGMLSYVKAPERAIAEAFRLLAPGGVFGAREMAKQGDWYSGPHAEVRYLFLRVMIAGMIERGGDPYLGSRLKRLLTEIGFARVEGYPSYSQTLSPKRLLSTVQAQLDNPDISPLLAAEGIVTDAQRTEILRKFQIWADDEESVAAVAEFKVWGIKPEH